MLQAELIEHRLFHQLCMILEQSQDLRLLEPTLCALGNLATDLDRCECCSLAWQDWLHLLPWPVLWGLVRSAGPPLQVTPATLWSTWENPLRAEKSLGQWGSELRWIPQWSCLDLLKLPSRWKGGAMWEQAYWRHVTRSAGRDPARSFKV